MGIFPIPGGGSDPNPLVFVCLTSFLACQNHPEVLKHVLFKKILQEKNDIFDIGVPMLEGAGGVCPRGKNSHVISFFSEDVP